MSLCIAGCGGRDKAPFAYCFHLVLLFPEVAVEDKHNAALLWAELLWFGLRGFLWEYESCLRAAVTVQAVAVTVMVSRRDGTAAEGKIPYKSGCFLWESPIPWGKGALPAAPAASCILHPVPFIYPQLHLESSSCSLGCPLVCKLAASHGVHGSWVCVSPKQCMEREVTALGCEVTRSPTLPVPSRHIPIKSEHFQRQPLPLPFLFTIGPYFLSFYWPSLAFITYLLLPSDSLLISLPSALFPRSMYFAHILVYLLPGHPGGKGIFFHGNQCSSRLG